MTDTSERLSWAGGQIAPTPQAPHAAASPVAPAFMQAGTASSFIAPHARPSQPELRLSSSPLQTKSTKGTSQKSGRLGTVLLSMLVVMLVVAAGLMVWKAFTPKVVDAPVPASEFEKPAGGTPSGPTGTTPVALDGGGTMSTAKMAPNTLFIPALGAYMPVEADETFVSSHYAGFETIKIPSDPSHGVRYAGGAPMRGGQAGTTMIASHVSSTTAWGALRYLYKLTGGEMLYTKDSAGALQSWQLTTMRVEVHTEFPQEYWSPEGERQLVVTTCGGTVTPSGRFEQNIFTVAVPVDPQPKTAEQLAAEAAAASTPAATPEATATPEA